jgi:hypothetical protein
MCASYHLLYLAHYLPGLFSLACVACVVTMGSRVRWRGRWADSRASRRTGVRVQTEVSASCVQMCHQPHPTPMGMHASSHGEDHSKPHISLVASCLAQWCVPLIPGTFYCNVQPRRAGAPQAMGPAPSLVSQSWTWVWGRASQGGESSRSHSYKHRSHMQGSLRQLTNTVTHA